MDIHMQSPIMRTVQMTLDEDLVKEVDRLSKRLRTTRSAFTREALLEALDRYRQEQLDRKHGKEYERYPVTAKEFSAWEAEQAWGDE